MILSSVAVPETPITPHINGNPFTFNETTSRPPDDSPLAQLYTHLLTRLEIFKPLMAAASNLASSHSEAPTDEFNFLPHVIWPEISTAISDKLGNVIFAAGRPDDLHKVHFSTLTIHDLKLTISTSPPPTTSSLS